MQRRQHKTEFAGDEVDDGQDADERQRGNPLTNSWLSFVTHAPEPLNEIESRSTAGKNSLSNLWFFTFETHEHGSFTDSIVYPSRRAFKVAKFSSSKQPGRYGLVAELYFHDEAGWSWGYLLAIDLMDE